MIAVSWFFFDFLILFSFLALLVVLDVKYEGIRINGFYCYQRHAG